MIASHSAADLSAAHPWCESPVPPHPKGALLDWDLVTVEAIWVKWTHCHAQQTSLRWFELRDMVPPIPPTVSSSSYHQEDGSRASEPLRQTAQKLFSPDSESPELNSHRPLWNHLQTPYLLKHGPLHPPQPYHITERTLKLFCAIRSVLHTGEWACTTTCSNTLSSIRTRHFTSYYVYIIPQKDWIVYVWLHAHALQITLHCSPASCLTYDVSLCTCTAFIWSIRTVCIVCIL